jgi:hypothetical protein
MDRVERELAAASRVYDRRARALAEAAEARNAAVRAAMQAKIPSRRIMALTGLSRSRVDQVRRRSRI